MLRKMTVTLTADGAGDDTKDSTQASGYRTPMRVLRVDFDASGAAGAGAAQVEDELATVLASTDASTYLFTPDDGTGYVEGVLCAGPLTFTISGWTEADELVYTVFYTNE